jgi:hypothetical protein
MVLFVYVTFLLSISKMFEPYIKYPKISVLFLSILYLSNAYYWLLLLLESLALL